MSLKSEVLKVFESTRGAYVSGQELADNLGVSRNAVWKAVNSLKAQGYDILSVTNKGYRLSDGSDKLSAEGISRFIGRKGLEIKVFDEIDSTSNEAKRMLGAGFDGEAIIVSEAQTAGRGRLGRSFFSPKGTGLYLSVIIHPNSNLSDAVFITTAVSVAVSQAIEALCDVTPQIKWVNDIYVSGKKTVGILTEAVSDFESRTVQSIVIGIGVNITTQSFPEELENIAGSLNISSVQRNQLAAEIASNIFKFSDNIKSHDFLGYYRSHSYVLGKEIIFTRNGESHCGKAVAIDDNGGLVVKLSDENLLTLSSGEISVRVAPDK